MEETNLKTYPTNQRQLSKKSYYAPNPVPLMALNGVCALLFLIAFFLWSILKSRLESFLTPHLSNFDFLGFLGDLGLLGLLVLMGTQWYVSGTIIKRNMLKKGFTQISHAKNFVADMVTVGIIFSLVFLIIGNKVSLWDNIYIFPFLGFLLSWFFSTFGTIIGAKMLVGPIEHKKS